MHLSRVLICACIALLPLATSRRIKLHPAAARQLAEPQDDGDSVQDEDYASESRENLPSSEENYNHYYGQSPSTTVRSHTNFNQHASKNSRINNPPVPRTKESSGNKAAPVQTIRNYNKVNDDGSFTFGYEAADGSFKEETRGTDCVVRGKYGYIDPDGNKREFTYVSGNPCDPNDPEGKQSDENQSTEDDSREPENVPQNYPKQRVIKPKPFTTTRAPTTVFQNTYAHSALQSDNKNEYQEEITHHSGVSVAPQQEQYNNYVPQEVTIRQRPKITVSTTPNSLIDYSRSQGVTVTHRPSQPPATTYRPVLQNHPHPNVKPVYSTTPQPVSISPNYPVNFNEQLEKFQREHNIPITTQKTTTVKYKTPQISQNQPQGGLPHSSNPIYESELVYDYSSGQYDSSLYQQFPQTLGDFQIKQRIQPYIQSQIPAANPHLVSLNQLQQVNHVLRGQQAAPQTFSQKTYENERGNLQVLNSQQLFQQQQELQNQQLQQDRINAAKKSILYQQHRFKPSPQLRIESPQIQNQISQHNQQGFYYLQPSGEVDSFLREHNISF